MPQMRTREFAEGMARRIDSEVREEDGVTATGDARRWCSRPVMRPVAGAERLGCQHLKSGAGRGLRWRPDKVTREKVPGEALATARCMVCGWARIVAHLLVEGTTTAMFRPARFC